LQIIGEINRIRGKKKRLQKVVAIDIPSGIDAETGDEWGGSVKADVTLALAFLKTGLLQGTGATQCGDLRVVDIGIAPTLESEYEGDAIEVITYASALKWRAKPRPLNSHKAKFGHVFIVGGSAQKLGAVKLAAKAALKAGCGLSTAIVPQACVLPFQKICLEEMAIGIGEKGSLLFLPLHRAEILDSLKTATGVIIGPGLTHADGLEQIVFDLMGGLTCPLVIDADALTLLAKKPDILKQKACPILLTPHPKEMARLCSTSVESVQKNRIDVAREFASSFGVTVVLKGFRTVIASETGSVSVITSGNSALATAGAGDVLAGMIASFLAQGYTIKEAAVRATFFHGAAGDLASFRQEAETLIASDVIEILGDVFHAIRNRNRWVLSSNHIPANPQSNWEKYLVKG
jgi:NAD(P)H-hydrate epimerase